jgi:predicted metal-dependent phosphoesterase TrpH
MSAVQYASQIIVNNIKIATVTGHESILGFKVLEQYLREVCHYPILLIPAREITTEYGDFLVFSSGDGLLSYLPRDMKFANLMKHIEEDEEEEFFIVWAHPFSVFVRIDRTGKVVPEYLAKYIDAVEVYNYTAENISGEDVRRIAKYLQNSMKKKMWAGTDSHTCFPNNLWRYRVIFNREPKSRLDVILMMKSGEYTIETEGFEAKIPELVLAKEI